MRPLPPLAHGGSTRAVTPDLLIRDTHRLLQAVGMTTSPRWVNRIVRRYWNSPLRGFSFDEYLFAELQLNDKQRSAMTERPEFRTLLGYSDPTGETACQNVMAEAG